MTRFALIDYGFGVARLWGDFDKKTVERFFYHHADQCFGIRKSISQCVVREIKKAEFPDVFGVQKADMKDDYRQAARQVAQLYSGKGED